MSGLQNCPEQRYQTLHDDLVLCHVYLNLRGLSDSRKKLESFLLENPSFEPANPHDDGCLACKIWRTFRKIAKAKDEDIP